MCRRSFAWALPLSATLAIACVDLATGTPFHFSLFYVVPILTAS
jgi:hypothetical protein